MSDVRGGEVIRLVRSELVADEGLVERLEVLLEFARSGELRSFSAAGLFANGDLLTSTGPSDDPFGDIGAVEILRQRLVEAQCG